MSKPSPCWQLEVVVHADQCNDKQQRYLVRCTDDVLWTSDKEAVLVCVRAELDRIGDDGTLSELP